MSAAAELLQEGGIAAVTVDAVTARSGVAKTTIYRQWPSRTALVVALLGELAPALPEPNTRGPLRAELIGLLTTHARQLEAGPWAAALPALIAAADRDSELDDVRRQVLGGAQAPFAALLEAHADELDDVSVRDTAAQLIGPLLHRRLIDTGPIDEPLIEQVVDGFLAGHRSTAPPPIRA